MTGNAAFGRLLLYVAEAAFIIITLIHEGWTVGLVVGILIVGSTIVIWRLYKGRKDVTTFGIAGATLIAAVCVPIIASVGENVPETTGPETTTTTPEVVTTDTVTTETLPEQILRDPEFGTTEIYEQESAEFFDGAVIVSVGGIYSRDVDNVDVIQRLDVTAGSNRCRFNALENGDAVVLRGRPTYEVQVRAVSVIGADFVVIKRLRTARSFECVKPAPGPRTP